MPGVTRSMPSSASSSYLSVSDALNNLSKAATVALNAVQGAQDHTYQELERTRAERDDALKALHDAQLDSKDMEVRVEGWKAALEKSDLTIKHQTETITQLRSEVQTWKTQLARLEESSRQEIEGWKEQYRRAEHERARLSARIEELIAGQLAWNAAAHAYTAPYTPRIGYAEVPEPPSSSSAATITRHASTSHIHRAAGTPRSNGRAARADADEDEDDRPLTSARKSKGPNGARQPTQPEPRAHPGTGTPARTSTARRRDNAAASAAGIADVPQANASRATPRTPAARSVNGQTGTQPRTQVIRRVTAIVDVKEEESDEAGGLEDLESAASGSAYDPEEDPPMALGRRRRRASNVSGRSKRAVREFDEDDEDEEGEGTVLEDDGMDGVEQGEDAEDDELLLGSKVRTRVAFSLATARQVLAYFLGHISISRTALTTYVPSHSSQHSKCGKLRERKRERRRAHRNTLELVRARSS
ncbi:hypothetical protein BD309DRAFT_1054696 [Dichomitus squalens]|nr:hypothetical protein BD309DRAFT_1054696 [Dichomitus squalens]